MGVLKEEGKEEVDEKVCVKEERKEEVEEKRRNERKK